jgi:hypothetical protein
VIWSHGGSDGRTSPQNVAVEWGQVFLRAGFVTIAIAHAPRSADEVEAMCIELELGNCDVDDCMTALECRREVDGTTQEGVCEVGTCRYWKPLNWDRPHDVSAVIDFLERETAEGARLDGLIDPSRIVYAGHSAGSGGTLMVAGATRLFGDQEVLSIDERPIAFISCSPQGPGYQGLTEDSLSGAPCRRLAPESDACLTRPHLFMTGLGDLAGQWTSEERRSTFYHVPEGDKYLLWNTELAARHGTFNFDNDACERFAGSQGLDTELYPERCDTYRRWLRSAALAFLDAVVHDRAEAHEYLLSDSLQILSNAAVSWKRR